MVEKSAYLLLPDLHYAVTKENRVNYLSEVLEIVEGFLSVNQTYRDSGYSTKLIFMGDVIDGNIGKAQDAMRCLDLFRYITSCFDSTYAVIGNHETTYTTNNPFWYMISSLGDADLYDITKNIQPQSIYPCLSVPDILVDGEVTFHFNHHGIKVKLPETDGGTHIGLFHQNVGSTELCKMWGAYDDIEKAPYTELYDYMFFGHLHLATGTYKLSDRCIGEWLGTCVGTNIDEVTRLGEELSLPIVLVEGGKLTGIEHKVIRRLPIKDVVRWDVVALQREVKSKGKAEAELHTVSIGETLLDRLSVSADNLKLGGILSFLSGDYMQVVADYKTFIDGGNLNG